MSKILKLKISSSTEQLLEASVPGSVEKVEHNSRKDIV
jgi:hypothetical protein